MWKWSRIGFGTYRLVDGAQGAILRHALRHANINVIDTSPNFGRGLAEEIVGENLDKIDIPREELCIMSHFGQISPNVFEQYGDNQIPGLHVPEDHPPFSFHPEVIEKELHESLKKLNTNYIDIYFIQSPEILSFLGRDFNGVTTSHDVMKALQIMFETLEKKVEQGYIKGYGLSSDALALAKFHPMRLSYEKLLPLAHQAAKAVGKNGLDHSFKAVQFGANIVETDGIDGVGKWAVDNGIFSIGTRPLSVNLSVQKDVMENHRLCLRMEPSNFQETLKNLKSAFKDEKFKDFRKFVKEVESLVKYGEFRSSSEWRETIEVDMLERIGELAGNNEGQDENFSLIEDLLQEAENEISYKAAPHTMKMLKTEGVFDPETSTARSLEDHALSSVYSEGNLSCILVGMTSIDHLKTVFNVLEDAPEIVDKGFRAKRDLRHQYSQLENRVDPKLEESTESESGSESEAAASGSDSNVEGVKAEEAIEKKTSSSSSSQSKEKSPSYLKDLEKTPEGVELMRLARSAVLKKNNGEVPTEEEDKARQKLFDLYVEEKKKIEDAKQAKSTAAAPKSDEADLAKSSSKKSSKKATDLSKMYENLTPEQREQLANIIRKKPQ